MTSSTPTRSVALHIGAHKTATTHLQRSFQVQQAALIENGVRYYGPESLRRPERGIADIFGLDFYKRKPAPTRSTSDQVEFMFKDGHRLILSDENFVGVLHDRSGRILAPLYPRAAPRVLALSKALDLGPIDVFVGVRDPASFLTSAYGQALLGGKKIGFSEYLAMNPVTQIYWPGLIARLRSMPDVGRIFVWRQEDYQNVFHDICAQMMGDAVDMRIMPYPERLHPGLSEAAVAHILSQGETVDSRKISAHARASFPIGDANPAFAPFTATDIAASASDYDHQLGEIDRIAGVTILRP